jgi:hypothetical protein
MRIQHYTHERRAGTRRADDKDRTIVAYAYFFTQARSRLRISHPNRLQGLSHLLLTDCGDAEYFVEAGGVQPGGGRAPPKFGDRIGVAALHGPGAI